MSNIQLYSLIQMKWAILLQFLIQESHFTVLDCVLSILTCRKCQELHLSLIIYLNTHNRFLLKAAQIQVQQQFSKI